MEFPKPTIDVEAAAREIILGTGEPGTRSGRDGSWPARDALRALLAQAWEEGRQSPPGAFLNPYGAPPAKEGATGVCPLCEAPLLSYNEPCTCTRTGTRRRR